MQRNKINIRILILGLLGFSPFLGWAQIVDIFLNKPYEFSTHQEEIKPEKEYAPGTIKIFQDKNKEEDPHFKNIEKQLEDIAIKQVKDDVAFFKLHSKAVNYLKQANELKRLDESEYYRTAKNNPILKEIAIKWVSVFNNHGAYYIQYNFDEVQVRQYYLANYGKNVVREIRTATTPAQQEVLKKLTLPRLTALYLIQTKMLDANHVERIRATQAGEENLPDFASRIDFSEAWIYPYFSGVMIEFPENSKSAEAFDNKAFRVLLKENEIVELLAVFQEFKPVFSQSFNLPSRQMIEALNNDENFDLSQYNRAPSNLELFKTALLPASANALFSVTIRNYQKIDSVRNFLGSKKFFFNENGDISRMEERYHTNLTKEEKYTYDKNNRLSSIQISGSSANSMMHYYNGDILSHTITINPVDYQTAYGRELRDLRIREIHFVFHNNYRYSTDFNVIGDFNNNKTLLSRSVSDKAYCTDHFCILTANGQKIAIKKKSGSPVDVLFNAKNQPVESYFDNDRYRYLFTYDHRDRISSFTSLSGVNKKNITFEYFENKTQPLVITEISPTSIVVREFEIEYYK